MRFFFTLLLLVAFAPVQSMTTGKELFFSHLTTEQGLSSNSTLCIFQDRKGFLWFGTEDGLNMFDGYGFTVFRHYASQSNSISGNSVFDLLEDSKGKLWIATSNGIDIFERETMSFIHVPFVEPDIAERFESYTRVIKEDKKGNILIANTNGIFIYDSIQQGFVRFLKNIPDYGPDQQEGIRSMLIDKKNRIWIGSLGYGFFGYDLNKEEVIARPSEMSPIRIQERIYVLAEDYKGNIWAGTEKGIFIIQADLSGVIPLREIEDKANPSSRVVSDIFFESEKTVWLGTEGGLFGYDMTLDEVEFYTSNEFNTSSLNNSSIRAIFKDRQGLIWIGTGQGGINFAQSNLKKKFTHIKREAGLPNSIGSNYVSAIYEDREGLLWIGTDGGGLDRLDRKSNTIRHYVHESGKKRSINGNKVLTITEDRKGNIWIGEYLTGINLINKQTGTITGYQHDPQDTASLSNNDVRDIFIENDTAVWVATNGGGLNLLNPATGKFKHFTAGGANSLNSNWCMKIFQDSENNLWIGTYNGARILNASRDRFTVFDKNSGEGGISNSWVYSFAEDHKRNIWVGTANGLNYYDKATEKFTQFLISQGLPNEVINGILIHTPEEIWLSTNDGLTRFNPVTMKFQNFDEYDGLQGKQYIHGSYFQSKTGEMFFGGLNGLNIFHPDSLKSNTYIPPVYLTDMLIYFKPVEIGAKDSPLEKSITESDKITLRYDQSVITFKYTALNYLNSQKNQYAYMLEGFDKDWNYVGLRREATYTSLNPGVYVFRVKASNDDGLWNEEGVSIKVVVLPPWWKTLFFRLSVIIFLGLLILSLYYYQVDSLKKQKLLLEEQVGQRTSEINEKNLLLSAQASELSKINSILEERKQQIEFQAEGLAQVNTLLEERQQQIEEQTEELLTQKEDLENANKHLQELNSTKDKFFSIIAHDLKNPFNTILGFAELLSKNFVKLTDEKRHYFADIIFKSTVNVFNLLDNLLQWSRSQTSRIIFDPVILDLKPLIGENIDLLKETSQQKNITLDLKVEDGYTAYADRNMFNTVVRNLLSNAVKFSSPGGTVRIGAEPDGKLIKIYVSDDGIGIPKNEMDNLFRVDAHFSREGTAGEGGTGLGLILCNEYVTKNDGKIWVESEEGKGTTFYFTLPLNSS
jgi:signal transduction histidine kinase/ligand-binding sensor domain-containing protein